MKKIKIGLLWHSLESANLGVGALSYAQMHIVSDVAIKLELDVEFIMMGWVDETQAHADSRVINACQVNAKRLLGLTPELHHAIKECDLILDIGEGDSFSDIYGWKRLVYLVGTKILAKSFDIPLIMSPQTIGPFKNPLAAKFADYVMKNSRAVFSRDRLSTAYFRSRNLDVDFYEAIDVAFALPFDASEKENKKIRVGINVSGLLWAGGYTGTNQFGLSVDYREVVLELIQYFNTQEGVEVFLVPHVVTNERESEDDLRASQEVSQMATQVQIAGPFRTAMEAKGFISGLDFFMGGRMHACIAAFSSGVASVPMAYSRKFTGLFNTLGYHYVADCTKESNTEVLDKIKEAFNNRQDLEAETRLGNEIANERIADYKLILGNLLLDIKNG